MEDRINIRIAKQTHRRLNLIKGQMGLVDISDSVPTLDDVINAGLDLLEKGKRPMKSQTISTPLDIVVAQP